MHSDPAGRHARSGHQRHGKTKKRDKGRLAVSFVRNNACVWNALGRGIIQRALLPRIRLLSWNSRESSGRSIPTIMEASVESDKVPSVDVRIINIGIDNYCNRPSQKHGKG